jgi:hypothetical protein
MDSPVKAQHKYGFRLFAGVAARYPPIPVKLDAHVTSGVDEDHEAVVIF